MQHKALTLAVAAALAGVAGSASAAFTYTAANTAVVNISGSSATNTQLKLWAQNVLCDSTNQVPLTNDSNNFAVVCTPKPGKITLSAGKTNIAVVKNSVGGSGQGITPEIAHSTLPMLNVFGAPAARSTPFPISACPTKSPPSWWPPVPPPATSASWTPRPLNVVTFGTPVTLGLYHALQDAQIASGKLASSCKGTPGTNNRPRHPRL